MEADDLACPREQYIEHVAGFVAAFVMPDRRQRWLHLLAQRPKQLLKNSHKLLGHLDEAKCDRVESLDSISESTSGVYFDFHADSDLVLVNRDRAMELGSGHDAIFSVTPGRIAFYFFHEDWIMACRG